MKAKKNEIRAISFIRKTDDIDKKPTHEITLHLNGKIPAMGYSAKELIEILKRYINDKRRFF